MLTSNRLQVTRSTFCHLFQGPLTLETPLQVESPLDPIWTVPNPYLLGLRPPWPRTWAWLRT